MKKKFIYFFSLELFMNIMADEVQCLLYQKILTLDNKRTFKKLQLKPWLQPANALVTKRMLCFKI